MASAELADIYSQIWSLMEKDREDEARSLQELEAIVFKAMRVYPRMRPRKEILVRRGVFSGNYCRNQRVKSLDSGFMREIGYALKPLERYYTV